MWIPHKSSPAHTNDGCDAYNAYNASASMCFCSKMSKKFSEKDLPSLKKLIAAKMYNPLYVPLVHHNVCFLCGLAWVRVCACIQMRVFRVQLPRLPRCTIYFASLSSITQCMFLVWHRFLVCAWMSSCACVYVNVRVKNVADKIYSPLYVPFAHHNVWFLTYNLFLVRTSMSSCVCICAS